MIAVILPAVVGVCIAVEAFVTVEIFVLVNIRRYMCKFI